MNSKRASSGNRPTPDRALAIIAFVALAARLFWVLAARPVPQLEGGDGAFYLTLGWSIATGVPVPATWSLAVGPVYPLYLALCVWLSPGNAAQVARVGQALLDTLTCLIVYDLARRTFDRRAGLIAAAWMAVDLRFIVQTGEVYAETVFTLLLVAGVWAFVAAKDSGGRRRLAGFAASGVVLVLTALTRAAAAPLVALFALAALLPKPSRTQLAVAGLIGLVVFLAIGGWTLKTYRDTGQIVLMSNGFGGNFWLGSRGDGQWHGLDAFNRDLLDLHARYHGGTPYVEDALKTIAADPLAYARLLFTKVTSAYLQPQGTVAFPGASLKELALSVLRGQLSVGDLLGGEAFWPKLIIYVFHFAALIGGAAGAGRARRNWLKTLPLVLPILYFTAIYTLLTIIPRYIFPVMPFYIVLASSMHNAQFTMPKAQSKVASDIVH